MTWFKVDDKMHSHPKTEKAGPAAIGLWTIAGSWSSDQLTDGLISEERCARLIGDRKTALRLAQQLVDAGFWLKVEGGYQFHDWPDYQPTAAGVRAELDRKRKNVSDFRARQNQNVAADETGDVTGYTAGNEPDTNRVPVPSRPDPRSEIPLPPSPARPAPTKEPKSPRKRPATRQPDIGVPEWLAALRVPSLTDPRWGSQVAAWLDHHRAKDSHFADWAAAWRMWSRNAESWGHVAPAASTEARPTNVDPRIITDEDGVPTWDWDAHGPPPEGLPPGTRHRNHPSTKPRSA